MGLISTGVSEAEAASRVCKNLQAQLNGGGGRKGNAATYNRFAKAAKRQQRELSRAQRLYANGGCRRSNSRQCRSLKATVSKMQRNYNKLVASRDRAKPSGGVNKVRVRAAMLANGCFAKPKKQQVAKKPKRKSAVKTASIQRKSKKSKKVIVRRGADKKRIAKVRVTKPKGPAPLTSLTSGYRSVCVRLCDGYFFPVSFSTDTSSASRDQLACSALCPGSEVRLYMHKVPEEESEDMRDVDGNRYVDLNTAFAYLRTRNVSAGGKACRCGKVTAPAMTPIPEGATDEAKVDPAWKLFPAYRPELHADPETMANLETGLTAKTLSRLINTPLVGELAPVEKTRMVRVVGTEFLPDPEAAIDLQAQARTSVQ